jgi:rod shape-determining protein MreD
MNWLVFAIFSAVALVLEVGLRPLWHLGAAGPCLLLILAVYIALAAPPVVVYWAMLVLGLLMDLSDPGSSPALMGPAALGFLVGGYLALQLRGVLYRDSTLALAVSVFIVGVFVYLVIAALLAVRELPFLGGMPNWDPWDYLLNHFLDLIYSSAVALPMGWLLQRTRPLWRFHGPSVARGY